MGVDSLTVDAGALSQTPSADITMIRARRANECGKLREREIESNCSRSAGLTFTTTLGLPIGHCSKFARQFK